MPSLVAPLALKAATNASSWRLSTTMSGSDSSRWYSNKGKRRATVLTLRSPSPSRTPPRRGQRRRDLLQVTRPEQPAFPVGEAHLQGYIIVTAIVADDLADPAMSLDHPLVLAHPHPCADHISPSTRLW